MEDLHKMGHGISYTESQLTEDKWTKRSSKQSTIIHPNISKGMPTTIIDVDKINWKNKDLDFPETQNTNSILIQNGSDDNETSRNIQLQGVLACVYVRFLKKC